eukprot:gene246-824_t
MVRVGQVVLALLTPPVATLRMEEGSTNSAVKVYVTEDDEKEGLLGKKNNYGATKSTGLKTETDDPWPSFVPPTKIFLVFIAALCFFSGLYLLLEPFFGIHETDGNSLAISAHGGRTADSWNDIQIYDLVQSAHGGLESNEVFSGKLPDSSGLFGKKLREAMDVIGPRGMALFKPQGSEPDAPPGMFVANAFRNGSKILYYPNVCQRHDTDLTVWKNLEGTGCVHPYGISVLDDRLYVVCQTSQNVFYLNVNNPDDDPVYVASLDNPRGIATSHSRKWIYIAGTNYSIDVETQQEEEVMDRVVVIDTHDNSTQFINMGHRLIGVVLHPHESIIYVGERTILFCLIFEMRQQNATALDQVETKCKTSLFVGKVNPSVGAGPGLLAQLHDRATIDRNPESRLANGSLQSDYKPFSCLGAEASSMRGVAFTTPLSATWLTSATGACPTAHCWATFRNTGRIHYHNATNLQHLGFYEHKHLEHPAGLTIDDDYLYVVCQNNQHVVAINLESGDAHIAVKRIHPRSELALMLPCRPV